MEGIATETEKILEEMADIKAKTEQGRIDHEKFLDMLQVEYIEAREKIAVLNAGREARHAEIRGIFLRGNHTLEELQYWTAEYERAIAYYQIQKVGAMCNLISNGRREFLTEQETIEAAAKK